MERKERINREIRVPKVHLIDENGKNLGIMDTRDAIQRALELNLDLVEVNPDSRPPLCKILDFGKMKYEKSKNQKKVVQKGPDLKIIKISYGISEPDLLRKSKEALEFLESGCIVNVSLQMRGKENAHPEVAILKIKKFLSLIDLSECQSMIRHEGRNLNLQLNPSHINNRK
jgi:translation initiation factor IF-3